MSRGQRVLGMSSVESHTDEFLPRFRYMWVYCEAIAWVWFLCCGVSPPVRQSDSQTGQTSSKWLLSKASRNARALKIHFILIHVGISF